MHPGRMWRLTSSGVAVQMTLLQLFLPLSLVLESVPELS